MVNSRRKFLGAAISILLMAVMTACSGTSSGSTNAGQTAEEDVQGRFASGEYSGSGTGYSGVIGVTLTCTDSAITAVVIDASEETPEIGQTAAEMLEEQILDAQGAGIDGVTGATATTEGVLQALEEALAQAEP